MKADRPWPRIAVVGAGAVGGYFGGLFAHAGAPVVLIGRAPFVEAVNARGLEIDARHLQARVRVQASTELAACRDAELILLCVKTVDTEATARSLAPLLTPGARIITLQNGVEGAERVRALTGRETLAAVVYVAVSVPAPGHVRHVGRGDLIVGPDGPLARTLAHACAWAGIGCRITPQIEGELWVKLLWNCALNAASALAHANYGRIIDRPDGRTLIEQLVTEFMAVASAARISLPGIDDAQAALSGALALAAQMPEQFSSTAQDLERGRPTEIDALNGDVVRRATVLGVATPVNRALYTLVKLREVHARATR